METLLLTVGYEGKTPAELLDALHRNHVAKVVDVRQLPLSRKRGFSKTVLSDTLTAHGIEYVGMRELGTPAPMRNRYKRTGDFGQLKREYLLYLDEHDASLEELYRIAASETCCLLCFEREPEECHRSVLARAVARRNGRQFTIQHI